MSDNETETETDDETLSDDQLIWARNLRDDIQTVRDASDEVLPIIEELIEGERTKEEYEEWVEENEETFKDVRLQ